MVEHFYPEYEVDSDAGLLQAATNWAADADDLRQQINDYFGSGGTNIELVCTENNADAGSQGRQSTSLVNGLYLADSLSQIMKTEFDSWLWWIFENGQDTSGDFDPSLYGWRTYGDFGLVLNASTRYPTFYAMKLMQYYAQTGRYDSQRDERRPAARRLRGKENRRRTQPAGHQQGPHQHAYAPDHPRRVLCRTPVATVRSYGIPQDDAARTNAPLAAQDIATGTFTRRGSHIFVFLPSVFTHLVHVRTARRPLVEHLPFSPNNIRRCFVAEPLEAYTLQTNGNLSTTNWAESTAER